MNTAFLLNKYAHLRTAYGTEKEFTDHLLSGEVTMTIPDVIAAFEEYKATQSLTLPSRYKHGTEVKHILIDESKVHKTTVIKVHFTESTVTYDIELQCYYPEHETPKPGFEVKGELYYHRMYNVPSAFLI